MNINLLNKYNNLSVHKLIFIVIFIIISYRILLPYGDEPDFIYVAEKYYLNIFSYSWNSGLTRFNTAFGCGKGSITGEFFDYLTLIEPFYCNSSLQEIFFRSLIQVFLTISLIFFSYLFTKNNSNISDNFLDYKKNIEFRILLASILFPTCFYYFGIYSNEQFFIIFSFFLFLFRDKILWSILILLLLLIIDNGNGIVVSSFYLYFLISKKLIKINTKFFFFINIFFILILILFHPFFIDILSKFLQIKIFSDISYFKDIYSWINDDKIFKNQLLKYPNYYKLIVTYMSMMFMTPNYVKSIAVLLIFTSLFIISLLKYFPNKKKFSEYFFNFFISIFFIMYVVLLMPSHSWFKYYVFTIPFLFGIICEKINYYIIILLLLISNILTILSLSLYRFYYFINA